MQNMRLAPWTNFQAPKWTLVFRKCVSMAQSIKPAVLSALGTLVQWLQTASGLWLVWAVLKDLGYSPLQGTFMSAHAGPSLTDMQVPFTIARVHTGRAIMSTCITCPRQGP